MVECSLVLFSIFGLFALHQEFFFLFPFRVFFSFSFSCFLFFVFFFLWGGGGGGRKRAVMGNLMTVNLVSL